MKRRLTRIRRWTFCHIRRRCSFKGFPYKRVSLFLHSIIQHYTWIQSECHNLWLLHWSREPSVLKTLLMKKLIYIDKKKTRLDLNINSANVIVSSQDTRAASTRKEALESLLGDLPVYSEQTPPKKKFFKR